MAAASARKVLAYRGVSRDKRARSRQKWQMRWGGLELTDAAIRCPRKNRLPARIGETMIVLGVILLLIGYFTNLGILTTIGLILLVVGAVLWLLGAVGRPVGGRKVWF
jgi:hypothetical protein